MQSGPALGPWLCWGVVFADVGSSVYYVPGLLGANAGLSGRAAFFVLAVSVVAVFLAFKYAEIAARYPCGGGVVSVAGDAFGPFVGCLGGVLIITDYLLTSSIGAMSGARYLGALVRLHGAALPLACTALIGLGILNLAGIRASAMVSLAMGLLGLVTQVLVMGVTAVRLGPADWALVGSLFTRPDGASASTLLVGFGTAWLAWSGLESLGQIGGALAHPRRRVAYIAMALVVGTVMVTAPFLTAFSTALLHARGGPPLRTDRLISELAGFSAGPPLEVMTVVAATSLLIFSANTAILGGYHVLVALARQGFMPAWMSDRNRRFGTPHVAIALTTLLPVLILLAVQGRLELMGELYAFGLLGAFTLSSAGLDRLRWRDRQIGPWFWIGVATTATIALAWATNLFAKPVATVFGGSLTFLGMLTALAISDGWCDRVSLRYGWHAAALRLGRWLSALADTCHAHLSLDRNDLARVSRKVARARQRRGQAHQAIAAYRCAVAFDRTDLASWLQLAGLYLDQDSPRLAIEALRAARELDPTSTQSHCRLGVALARTGQWAEALAAFDEAIRLDAHCAVAHHERGLILNKQGDAGAAAAALARAATLEPDQRRYQRHLGFAYRILGESRQASACFQKVLDLDLDQRERA